MRPGDLVRLAVNSLTARKLRTFLTALGIVIGTLAVVSIVALSGSFRPATSLVSKLTLAVFGVLVVNFPVYEFYRQRRGFLFALSALPLHILAQAVSACALCTGWLLRSTIGDRTPDAATQAWAEIGLESWPPVPKRRVVDGPQRLPTSRLD